MPQKQRAESAVRLDFILPEAQGVIEVDKTETVQEQKGDQVSGKEKRKVEPSLFAVEVLTHPGKNSVSPQEEEQEKQQRKGKKCGKGF
jgi:hypothetical protein